MGPDSRSASDRSARLEVLSAAHKCAQIVVALIAVPVLYLAAAAVGAVWPRNFGWQPPDEGVLIFVSTNGVHVDLVLPAEALDVDWYASLPPAHVASPRVADGWVSIGWGQRDFYLETAEWADLKLATALRALTGGAALMHVGHGSRPLATARDRPVMIDPHGYRRMARAIAATFATDSRGQPIPLLGRGYEQNDVFYEAHGVYHAFRTSNQWTADMLALAGVEIGVFTPFASSVMWRLKD
jgi:uncharacterized protein (TIGR02117 family)